MADEEVKVKNYHPADSNGDGKVSDKEHEMYMEFKRKELEDADAMRDAQRTIAVAGIVAAFFGAQAIGKKK